MNNCSGRRGGNTAQCRYLQNQNGYSASRIANGNARYGGTYTRNQNTACQNNTECDTLDYSLAMVYSPAQEFVCIYDAETALNRGTVFKELDKPFEGESVTGARR